MKKILSVLLILAMLLCFGACANKEVQDAVSKLDDAYSDAMESGDLDNLGDAMSEYAESVSGNIKTYDNIEDYIAATKSNPSYNETLQSTEAAGMSLSLEAEGNNLVYKYTYTVPVSETAADILTEEFANNIATFKTIADTIRMEAPCIEKVVWEYYTTDGQLLASLEK